VIVLDVSAPDVEGRALGALSGSRLVDAAKTQRSTAIGEAGSPPPQGVQHVEIAAFGLEGDAIGPGSHPRQPLVGCIDVSLLRIQFGIHPRASKRATTARSARLRAK